MAEEEKITNETARQKITPSPVAPPLPDEEEVEYEYIEEVVEEDGEELRRGSGRGR